MLGKKKGITADLQYLTKDLLNKSEDLVNFKTKFPTNKTMLSRTMMVVEGQNISVKKFLIFEVFCKTGDMAKTAEICNVSRAYCYKLKQEEWFGALQHEFIDSRQRHIHMELAERSGLLTNAIVKIWDGTADPKLASALVRSFEAFCKMGKAYGANYVDPLISSTPSVNIDNRKVTTTEITVDIEKAVLSMSSAEIDEYSRTGVLPHKLTEAATREMEMEDRAALDKEQFEAFSPDDL